MEELLEQNKIIESLFPKDESSSPGLREELTQWTKNFTMAKDLEDSTKKEAEERRKFLRSLYENLGGEITEVLQKAVEEQKNSVDPESRGSPLISALQELIKIIK